MIHLFMVTFSRCVDVIGCFVFQKLFSFVCRQSRCTSPFCTSFSSRSGHGVHIPSITGRVPLASDDSFLSVSRRLALHVVCLTDVVMMDLALNRVHICCVDGKLSRSSIKFKLDMSQHIINTIFMQTPVRLVERELKVTAGYSTVQFHDKAQIVWHFVV